MTEDRKASVELGAVQKTLLIPLYGRAVETTSAIRW
jgi:O-methyltransferase involved in polyketide biosynthesis